MDDLPIKSLLISMRTKYPHAFSLDMCQFPSGSVATPSGHSHFAAVVPQGYRGECNDSICSRHCIMLL